MLRIWLMCRIPSSTYPCRGVFECTRLDIWRSIPFLLYSSGELLRICPSGWHLFTPSWWGSRINTLLSTHVHFPPRTLRADAGRTHADRLLTEHPRENPARHACTYSKTLTRIPTKWRLSPKASQCIELSQRASRWGPKEENRAHNAWRPWNSNIVITQASPVLDRSGQISRTGEEALWEYQRVHWC